MNLAPTPRTVRLAKALVRHTPRKGAEATVAALRDVEHDQLVAFVHVLARYAAANVDALPSIATESRPKPLRFTDAERLAAQRRYSQGDRSPRTVAARSEYQRLWRESAAARKAREQQDGSAA